MITQHKHVLLRPDTYIGSIKEDLSSMWIYDDKTNKIIKSDILYIQGLYKIFDEVLVNARDHVSRDTTCKNIKVTINQITGEISIFNDGIGIPIKVHKEHNIYIPEMIFGKLLTSSNYEGNKKITGGKNGYGAKLANIFSTYFCVETVDGKNKFTQIYRNNMYEMEPFSITDVPNKLKSKTYTKISFIPDYKKFGITCLSDDMAKLLKKRVYDVAACTTGVCTIYLNDEPIIMNSFIDYINLYYENDNFPSMPIYEEVNDRWKVCAIYDPNSNFSQISFVNGMNTMKGGTHVKYVYEQIARKLINNYNNKHKNEKLDIKEHHVRDNLTLFVDSIIEDPDFTSQTKDELSSKASEFGSKCEISDDFIKELSKTKLMEHVIELAQFKQSAALKKTDGKKTSNVRGIEKYDKAKMAGTKSSHLCRLILTEGDSAKNFALAGTEVIGRDHYGVFPLKGKPLNVREANKKQLLENTELNNIKKILGLKVNKVYNNVSGLNYGGIIILTDQDPDGSHIKGLLINMIHLLWPSLLINIPNFIQTLGTPIVKVKSKNNNELKIFYTLHEYRQWTKVTDLKKWHEPKYYKGLGTSDADEAKECFIDFSNHLITYTWEHSNNLKNIIANNNIKFDDNDNDNDNDDGKSEENNMENNIDNDMDVDAEKNSGPLQLDILSKSHNAITLAFSKSRVDDRKKWLLDYDESDIIIESDRNITFSSFVNRDLKHFSFTDIVRSISSLVDGFKPSQRKIYYAAVKKPIDKREIKVAQFSGYVAEQADYHHGEVSLQKAIISMAQTFVGSNNINLLLPNGNFGSRRQGGADAASARYIHTQLNPIANKIFRKEDEKICIYVEEDGQKIEPVYYVPVIPMLLVNGAVGIGTGFSTNIPSYYPLDIVNNLKNILNDKPIKEMLPWYRNFTGVIKKIEGKIYSIGKYESIDSNTIKITELPLGTWIENYKEFLDSILCDDKHDIDPKHFILKYDELGSNDIIHFVITFSGNICQELIKTGIVEKKMKLISSIPLTNLCLHNAKHKITKYDTIDDILLEYYEYRLYAYDLRKKHMIKMLTNDLEILNEKIKFIRLVCADKIILKKTKKDAVIQQFIDNGLKKMSNDPYCLEEDKDYSYTHMDIWSITDEKIIDYEKEYQNKLDDLNNYNDITVKALWLKELGEFEDAYTIFMENDNNKSNTKNKNKKKITKKQLKNH